MISWKKGVANTNKLLLFLLRRVYWSSILGSFTIQDLIPDHLIHPPYYLLPLNSSHGLGHYYYFILTRKSNRRFWSETSEILSKMDSLPVTASARLCISSKFIYLDWQSIFLCLLSSLFGLSERMYAAAAGTRVTFIKYKENLCTWSKLEQTIDSSTWRLDEWWMWLGRKSPHGKSGDRNDLFFTLVLFPEFQLLWIFL
jgi:hypothetical protein